MNYKQQLADPRWQRRRLEILQLANWECSDCGGKEEQLHVHHHRYIKGRMAWDYSDSDLGVLCKTCHQQHHEATATLQNSARESSYGDRFFVGLVSGFLDASLDLDTDSGVIQEYACPDGVQAGVLASMFFHSSRHTKAAIAKILSDVGGPMNPVEQDFIEQTLALDEVLGGR